VALLRSNRSFRILCTARSISFLGDSLSLVALLLYVEKTTGAALAVALLLLAGDFTPGPVRAARGGRRGPLRSPQGDGRL
jgi:hypothetical protein